MIDIMAQTVTDMLAVGGTAGVVVFLAKRSFKKMVEHSDLSNSNSRKLHNDPEDQPVKGSLYEVQNDKIKEKLTEHGESIRGVHKRIDALTSSQNKNTSLIIAEIRNNK